MSANIVINQYYFEKLPLVLVLIEYYVKIIMAKYTTPIIRNLSLDIYLGGLLSTRYIR